MSTLAVDPEGVASHADLIEQLAALRRAGARGMRKAKVGLDELAARTGIPRSTVHSYLSGRVVPSADALEQMVLALGGNPGAEVSAWLDALDRVQAHKGSQGTRRPQGTAPSVVSEEPRVGRSVPSQLPHHESHLVGRQEERALLTQLWFDPDERSSVIALVGEGGVGKTSLAEEWLMRHAEYFPDGVLSADLRGWGPSEPLDPARVLQQFLTALGVEGVSGDLDELQSQFRTLLVDRRMALLLDNARDAAQVVPLLPGAESVLSIVTSRDDLRPLTVLTGGVVVPLQPLGSTAAHEMVRQLWNKTTSGLRVPIDRCDGVPLALKLLGKRLVATASADEHAPLGDGRGVAGALDDTLAVLSASSERLARCLAVVPGRWIPDELVAALTADPAAIAELEAFGILEHDAASNGWLRHDVLGEMLHDAAVRQWDDFVTDLTAVLDWAVSVAAQFREPILPLVGRLAPDVRFTVAESNVRRSLIDRFEVLLAALAKAAMPVGLTHQAAVILSQMLSRSTSSRATAEWVHLLGQIGRDLLVAGETSHDQVVVCLALTDLATIATNLGDEVGFCHYTDAALETEPGVNDAQVRFTLLTRRGFSHWLLGHHGKADADAQEAMRLAERSHSWGELSRAEGNYAVLLRDRGRTDEALEYFLLSAMHAMQKEPTFALIPVVNLIMVSADSGRPAVIPQALAYLEKIRPHLREDEAFIPYWAARSAAARALQDYPAAVEYAQRGADVAQHHGDAFYQINARHALAVAYLADRQSELARGLIQYVIQDCQEIGYLGHLPDAYAALIAADTLLADDAALADDWGAARQVIARLPDPSSEQHLAEQVRRLVDGARPPGDAQSERPQNHPNSQPPGATDPRG